MIDFIFYRGPRVGKDGKIFRLWKFRTMVMNADKMGPFSVGEDDPRVTRLGKFLRKWKLDEIPNLINVLTGDMRLVGPRPEVVAFVNKMPPETRRIILSVKPGCLDLATLWNLKEGKRLKYSPNPDKTYEEEIWPTKLKLQVRQIQRRSS